MRTDFLTVDLMVFSIWQSLPKKDVFNSVLPLFEFTLSDLSCFSFEITQLMHDVTSGGAESNYSIISCLFFGGFSPKVPLRMSDRSHT